MTVGPAGFAQAHSAAGALKVLTVDETGTYVDPSGGGGGGGGDASAAKQDEQTALLGNIDSHVDQLEGYLDGVETAIASTNTKLNGGLPAALGAGSGLKVDGSGTPLPVSGTVTANAGTGTLAVSAASLPLPSGAATAAKQPALGTAGSASTDVITVQGIASGTAQPVTAGGYTTTITTTLTRVADTNVLAANDAINTATSGATTLAIANAARVSGGSGYITYARLATDQAANVSAYRLHFYNAAPAVTVQDNAAQSVLAVDQSKHIGSVDIPAVARVGTAGIPYSQATLTPMPFVAAATSIFCAVETVTGFTPASGQNFYITVGIEQN